MESNLRVNQPVNPTGYNDNGSISGGASPTTSFPVQTFQDLSTGEEFLFQDSDFEDEHFDPAAFVAKYRRVSSLEGLRDQLVSYSKSVKTQLYQIINRDYKDFITISTKLDGLDTRLDMIEKPLFDLQMDMSSLHTGIASSLHTIKDKIDEQQKISRKKVVVKAVLECMDQVAIAQSALQIESSSTNGSAASVNTAGDARVMSNRRYRMYRQSQLLHKDNNNASSSSGGQQAEVLVFEKDLFVCSEYERAASALCSAKLRLQEMQQSGAGGITDMPTLPGMIQSLAQQVMTTLESLKSKIRSHLEHYFSKASTSAIGDGALSPSDVIELRCFAHCLRALIFVDHTNIAEQCLASSIVDPYLKLHFAPGKVDGKGGRNSFAGLRDCFVGLLEFVKKSQLVHFLRVAEEVNLSSAGSEEAMVPVDLVLRGIWSPVAQLLQQREKEGERKMFSVGLAAVFSSCYRAVDFFLSSLPNLVSLSPTSTSAITAMSLHKGEKQEDSLVNILRLRVRGDKSVHAFLAQFKVDMYAQLRYREAMQRVDKVCELDLRLQQPSLVQMYGNVGPAAIGNSNKGQGNASASTGSASGTHAVRSIAETVYGYNNSTADSSNTVSTSASTLLKVTRSEVDALFAQVLSYSTATKPNNGAVFHNELFMTLAVEALLCLNQEVALEPMKLKMLIFSQRVLLRLLFHIVFVANLYGASSASSSVHQSLSNLAAGFGSGASGLVSLIGILTGAGCSRAEYDQMRTSYISSLLGSNSADSERGDQPSASSTAPVSPVKGSSSAAAPTLPPATPDSKGLALPSSTPLKGGGAGSSLSSLLAQCTLTVDQLILLVVDLLAFRSFVEISFMNNCRQSLLTDPSTSSIRAQEVCEKSIRDTMLPSMYAVAQVLWSLVTQTVVNECKKPLTSIKGIAGKYRMTNKPAPIQASPYVETILSSVRALFAGYLEPVIASIANSFESDSLRWKSEVVELVTVAMQEQVSSLLETVKQMDSALQRRAKHRTATTGGTNEGATLTDSDKIALQLRLDIQAFGEEIKSLGISPTSISAYTALQSSELTM